MSAERPAISATPLDCSPRALAARFGARAICRLRDGRDPYFAARLAASYAAQALGPEVGTWRSVSRFPTRERE